MTETVRTATNGFGSCHAVDIKGGALCGQPIYSTAWTIGHKPAGAVTCPACRALMQKGEGHGDSD